MTSAEFKALWVEALRSGEYAQTTDVLHNDEGFCCLGVACDVAIKHNLVPGARWERNARTGHFLFKEEGEDNSTLAVLPLYVQDLLGAESNNPEVPVNGNLRRLSTLNDDEGFSFAQIADLIEEQF